MTLWKRQTDTYFPLSVQISERAAREFSLEISSLRGDFPSGTRSLQMVAEKLRQRKRGEKVSSARLILLSLLNRAFRILALHHLDLRRCAFDGGNLIFSDRTERVRGLSEVQRAFIDLFPPADVWKGMSIEDFLSIEGRGVGRRSVVVELFLLAVQNGNPAAKVFSPLFDDTELRLRSHYVSVLKDLDSLLGREPVTSELPASLLALLRAPLEASPSSLKGQLDFIRTRWGAFLPPQLLEDILIGFDILREEETWRGWTTGDIEVPRFEGVEREAFSPDADWMSETVLIAKSVYVWLDQLSKKYARSIRRLDEIPQEEIETLALWGLNALWLIGIWKRSVASRRIKEIMGNPEAAASAYSLYDYVVDEELGGEEALSRLKERCAARGIRLACDVVPNHTGIYSRWTKEHPDWYIQLPHPPYVGYTFNGPDLSPDGEVGLFIEDGYYDHRDAAVVFKHVDRRSGNVRYIYHGNDGTHMPWNDTAQLNYLLPDVREAMIRTIIETARRFRIIRFDAAMTLAKKHYQRLWFPSPGGGGGIPSRSEYGMSAEEFERAFPEEFWREVVDRVAAEVPDTLLIAEAFWLMEGYFVRTLGMHRVYNSAFMNMLKREENGKYREVVAKILAFEPEILKRFVNFMNNPDEATAVEQFGKGEKYFAVAVLLATMPGLPMFGHGQLEGLAEKYGMEYRRAYWNESVDEGFLAHHRNQIFPLLRKRYLFSGVEHFQFYDFVSGGRVNHDVFAYTNRRGDERTFVVCHNREGETGGWVRDPLPRKGGAQMTLGVALGLSREESLFCRFRDHRTGLEFLRRSRDLLHEGLYLLLGPYHYHVFHDFREFRDFDGSWESLCEILEGRPVQDLDDEYALMRLAPVRDSLQRFLSSHVKEQGVAAMAGGDPEERLRAADDFTRHCNDLYASMRQLPGLEIPEELTKEAGLRVRAFFPFNENLKALAKRKRIQKGWERFCDESGKATIPDLLLLWTALFPLAHHFGRMDPPPDWYGGLRISRFLSDSVGGRDLLLLEVMLRHASLVTQGGGAADFLKKLLDDFAAARLLGLNRHEGRRFVSREGVESLFEWFFHLYLFEKIVAGEGGKTLMEKTAVQSKDIRTFLDAARRCDYCLDRLPDFA